jgi:hypothetical protein
MSVRGYVYLPLYPGQESVIPTAVSKEGVYMSIEGHVSLIAVSRKGKHARKEDI